MPLTKKGRAIKASFSKRYGKKAGQRAFYATMNKNKGLKRAAEGRRRKR